MLTNAIKMVADMKSADEGIQEKDELQAIDQGEIPEGVEELRSKAEAAFKEAVAVLKSEHGGTLMQINLMTDPVVARAVSAWPSVPREINLDAGEKTDPWDMVWFAPGQWMEAARVPLEMEHSVMLTIKQNHLVYPDGTMPQQIRAYLVQRGRDLLGLPTPQQPGG